MKTVSVGNGRECEIPTDWKEAEELLTRVRGAYYDQRGRNLARQSAAARVVYGLFGAHFLASDPTDALTSLLLEICKRRGAGLDGLEKPHRRFSTDEGEKQT
jgi:hypothetical protein